MNFMIFDIAFLILFVIFVSVFLYTRKKNLKREGLLYLYKTSWGMKFIDKVGTKYKKTLKFLSYVSISIGYILMACMIYLFGKIIYLYVAYPQIVRAIKVPPIMPLIPYIDKIIPGINLPPFYFTYWIIILALIAIPHEFAHGIFMRRYGIKIKSTGFGFLPFFFPVLLAAFVEQDEKSMKKTSNFKQMSVLSAGTFANLLTAIFFFIILFFFFSFAYAPSGIVFDNYAYSAVGIAGINMINNVSLTNPNYEQICELTNKTGISKIKAMGEDYILTKEFLNKQKNVKDYILLYDDSPAINSKLENTIISINNVKLDSIKKLSKELQKYSPGEKVTLGVFDGKDVYNQNLILGSNPTNKTKAWLGIGFNTNKRSGFMGKIVEAVSSFKKPHIYYKPNFGASEFIYNLLWWLILICISIALVNMVPVGIFDGGRFFYLTILSLTKNKKKAEKSFKYLTWFFLFLLLVLMVFWGISFI